jgi:S-adenosylmethionine decarboxylase
VLNDIKKIEVCLTQAAEECGAVIIEKVFHQFNPHGISGIIVIAESHLAIHTWPEYNYAAVDIFTCGQELSPEKAIKYIIKEVGAKYYNVLELKRGYGLLDE